MLLATVVPPSDLRTGASVKIGANVNWLVCQENCIPGDAALSLELPGSAESRPQNHELFAQWKSRLPGVAMK